jgi:hypothetical protein
MSLSAPDIRPRQMSPKRTPTEPRTGIACTSVPADIRRRELFLGRGIEREKDWDVALLASPISCSELSVLGRLPVGGSREAESGTIGGRGGGDIRLPRQDPRQRRSSIGVCLRARGISDGCECGHELRDRPVVRMLSSRQSSSAEGRT